MIGIVFVLGIVVGSFAFLAPGPDVPAGGWSLDAVPPAGPPIVLSDDGGWCWFEGPRAIVLGDRLVVGVVATGRHDASRRGDIEAIIYDFGTGAVERVELHDRLQPDDHNSPALLPLPDGRVLAAYSGHGTEGRFYYRFSEPDEPAHWGPIEWFHPGPASRVTYANLFRLAGERGRIYNFFRGLDGRAKPSYAASDDGGRTWSPGGVFIESPADRPYVCYASDGEDTIHLVYTEGHPRDFDNSLYHVFYRRGKLHRSDGTPIRELEAGLRHPGEGTRIYRGDANHVAWPCAIELDDRGYPRVAYSVQLDSAGLPPGQGGDDIRYRFARWDGSRWHDHALAYAGTRLYAGEDDYSGLVALDPDRPGVCYVSTNASPIGGAPLISAADGKRHYELFRGTTGDGGASWSWAPITGNSTVDNLRPIVPGRRDGRTMLLWLRGTYRSYTDYDLEVVGLLLEGVQPRRSAPDTAAVSPGSD